MKTTAITAPKGAGAAGTQGNAHAEPVKLRKRIGSTTLEVTVHFSETSQDKMEDILLRLIEREVDKVA